VIGLLVFIGTATAGVFVLRSRALQSLSPSVVGAYHNLIPICTIGLASLWLGEAITVCTFVGALAVVAGTELIRRSPVWRLRPERSWGLRKPALIEPEGRSLVEVEPVHVSDVPAEAA
jgi:drug/metabolite transporter (DMT)-like permease